MISVNSLIGSITAFWERRASLFGRITLGLLILLHGGRAWGFAGWQGHEALFIGALGLAITYLLAGLVYWRQGWSGLMAVSMMNGGVASTLQIVFPAAAGHIGFLVVVVQVAAMALVAVGNLVHRS